MLVKVCKICKISKPETEFHWRVKSKGYRRTECAECRSRIRAGTRQEEVQKGRLKRKANVVRRTYGVTLEYIDELATLGCNSCGTPVSGFNLNVDHDHACCPGEKACGNCVRGVLCRKCNLALGFLDDDPEKIRMLLRYLERYLDRNSLSNLPSNEKFLADTEG